METITNEEFYELTNQERSNFTGIVKWSEGAITYLKSGKYHREDGPAYIGFNGYKEWYFEGKLHNLNGPAIIWPDGKEKYFLYDKETTKDALYFLRDLLKLKGNKNAR
jgi:hypothetical protein